MLGFYPLRRDRLTNITPKSASVNVPPTAQAEAAAGMVVMRSEILSDNVKREALAEMMAGLVLNQSSEYAALESGGVVDMSMLGRALTLRRKYGVKV